LILCALTAVAAASAEVDLVKFFGNLDKLSSYVTRLAHLDTGQLVTADIPEWFWGFRKWAGKIGETLLIAYLGTVLGGVAAFMLCAFAAKNTSPGSITRFVVRRALEFCRSVPELVFALIFVVAFGLGPLPGVLAMSIHTAGALGKLFSEVVENIDMKPVDGIVASGGSWLETVRFAVLPQVITNLVSYGLLRFEINVRGATVMGFVGAGGISQDLLVAVRKFYYSDVSAILLMIIVVVAMIDIVTARLRHHLLGRDRAV
jgi:phosphonate transport system permease protein